MMGIKEREFKVRTQVCLDELVPENHFYRRLEAKLDLKFVRELVRHFYVPYGRASIDPVVFFKLQLIRHEFNIRETKGHQINVR